MEQRCAKILLKAQVNEASSDRLATEALVQFYKEKQFTPEEIVEHIQKAYGYFCGSSNSGDHPAGNFRIDSIGNHPEIRKMVGCSGDVAPAAKVGLCSF
jgi:hypothetical protein